MKKVQLILLNLLLFYCLSSAQQDTLVMNKDADGVEITIKFKKGEEHNHPLMAIWVEDNDSNYIETLYVAKSIANSIFGYGDKIEGVWKPGMIRRPAALPYWSHKRGIKAEDSLYLPTPENPVPDAITGPTPVSNFVLYARTKKKLPKTFRILFEINQSWDWNEYWTNNKYPDDDQYKTSSQPSIIYEAIVELGNQKEKYSMKAIGHGHYAGRDGKLYTDLSTITTAKEIAEEIVVEVK